MLSAAIRVIARSAAVQLEDIAIHAGAGPSGFAKGKGKEVSRVAQIPVHQEDPRRYSTPVPLVPPTPSTLQPELPLVKEEDVPTVAFPRHIEVEAKMSQVNEDVPVHHPSEGLEGPHSKTKVLATPEASCSTSEPHPVAPEVITPSPVVSAATSEPMQSSSHSPTTPPSSSTTEPASSVVEEDEEAPVLLRASKVPSSRIGRLFHYGSLAASLSLGAASESIRRSTGSTNTGSVFMSDANVRRLVGTLGRMRGAALKLGQFMSIQDNHMLPPEIEKVLQQVQANANYMPDWQMEKVMSTELGPEWTSLFSTFDRTPIASASIGQVHHATLASTGLPVAVKIQFPGIASSIASDLANLSLLLRSSALLPKGLYLQNTIAVMRRELEDECDYIREAESGQKFERLLRDDEVFTVPKVVEAASSGKVLTSEWMGGKPLSRMKAMSQATRDRIGTNILRLCLLELFHFRFMQTDPNWANFLYDAPTARIQLIDFGASREYSKEFMDGWYRLLRSAMEGDREGMRVESLNLGYLTGEEEPIMLEAHLDSMALVASPFSAKEPYHFKNQTITDSVRKLIPIMLKHRLTPPPSETYSLNRKLSGAFLMCAKLEAVVDCGKLWEEIVGDYKEGEVEETI
ncbi:aarF domain-containing kinase, partial [Tremellales sp. Uapishka_1]